MLYINKIHGNHISECIGIFYLRLCMIWESIPSISTIKGNKYLNELESFYLIFMIKNIRFIEYIYSYFMLILLDVAFDMMEEKKMLQIGFWNDLGYVSRNPQIGSVSRRYCISYFT